MKKCAGGLWTEIGNGDARVWVSYRADRDYDSRGDFWDIDWDNVKVSFSDIDITSTLSDSSWNHIEEEIQKDLE